MTGVLYLIVIAMWAVVLVPIFLKRHDRRALEQEVIKSDASSVFPKWHFASRAPMTPLEKAFVRRRRVFMGLLTTLVATFVAGLTGSVSMFWVALPATLNFAFVIAASNAATREQAQLRPHVVRHNVNNIPVAPAVQTQPAAQKPIVKINEEKPRTWKPVETPLPAYVTAQRATSFTRALEADRPWTSQEMLEQAAKLQEERAERIKQAQQRLEEARALAMEKARRAALAAAQNEQITRSQRAVGE